MCFRVVSGVIKKLRKKNYALYIVVCVS